LIFFSHSSFHVIL